MFERPFGQTNEQVKKAEEFLVGSGLKLEEEEDKGQYYHTKSSKVKSIDDAYQVSDSANIIAEDKVNNSELKDARLEDME